MFNYAQDNNDFTYMKLKFFTDLMEAESKGDDGARDLSAYYDLLRAELMANVSPAAASTGRNKTHTHKEKKKKNER